MRKQRGNREQLRSVLRTCGSTRCSGNEAACRDSSPKHTRAVKMLKADFAVSIRRQNLGNLVVPARRCKIDAPCRESWASHAPKSQLSRLVLDLDWKHTKADSVAVFHI